MLPRCKARACCVLLLIADAMTDRAFCPREQVMAPVRLSRTPFFIAPSLAQCSRAALSVSRSSSFSATRLYQLRPGRRVVAESRRLSSTCGRVTASVSQPPSSFPVTFFNTTVHIPGRLILLCVPALWASYAVCIKCLYALPWALSPALFNLLRLVVGTLMGLPSLLGHFRKARQQKSASLRAALVAGYELGAWTILVNVLQMNALRYTSASRGAFLNQMSTVIVPIAAYLFGMEKRLNPRVIMASIVSIFGVALLTLDNVSASFSLLGDGIMLLTAFISTTFILRTKIHSKIAEKGPLVPAKVLGQTTFAALYFVASALFSPRPSQSFHSMFARATPLLLMANAALVLWSGIFISWVSTHLQVRGQQLVSASETVIIFTTMPLWASIWAWPLGERFGPRGIIGASLILAATALSASDAGKKEDSS